MLRVTLPLDFNQLINYIFVYKSSATQHTEMFRSSYLSTVYWLLKDHIVDLGGGFVLTASLSLSLTSSGSALSLYQIKRTT